MKKGNKQQPFLAALIEVIGEILIFDLPVFETFCAWSVILWFIGFGILIIDTIAVIHFFLFK